jgi:hypothetical protein
VKIIISGIPGADGEYPIEGMLTNRELHEVKRETGLRAGEVGSATVAGDNDVVMAFAMIALRRAGKPELMELVWDAPVGDESKPEDPFVLLDTSDDEAEAKKAEDDALPPVPVLESVPPTEPSSEPVSVSSGPTFDELSPELQATVLSFSGGQG